MKKSLKTPMFQTWHKQGPLDPWNPLGPHPMDIRNSQKYFLVIIFHLDSFPTNFDDKLIEKPNFQKWSQFGSHETPFGTPHRTPKGPNVLLGANNIQLHPHTPIKHRNQSIWRFLNSYTLLQMSCPTALTLRLFGLIDKSVLACST